LLPPGQKVKAVGPSVMVPPYQTTLCYSWQDTDRPSSASSSWSHWVPNNSVHRQWPQGHSSALGMAFCLCCLWTSTLYQMVIHLVLFTQQYVLWASQFNGFLCGVLCGKVSMWCAMCCAVCACVCVHVVCEWCVCGVAPPQRLCMHVCVCCEIQQKRYFDLQIRCPSFLTDSDQWHTAARASEKSVKYKVSGKSIQLKPR
jgi:hypothetical protein